MLVFLLQVLECAFIAALLLSLCRAGVCQAVIRR